jgi:hypothetical protein
MPLGLIDRIQEQSGARGCQEEAAIEVTKTEVRLREDEWVEEIAVD